MKVAGLFAGIGGFERGFHAAGHEAALLCEIWPPARAVLRARFPDAALHEDVAALASLPADIDLLTAGFPCQDLSQAGATAGIGGAKSGLVSNVFRLLDAHPAQVVVLENVAFMLRLARGAAMRMIVAEFQARGYRWAYRLVNSIGHAPQRRERVFFVASRGDLDPWDALLVDETAPPAPETTLESHAHGFYWTEGLRGLGWAPDASPPLKNGSTVGIPSPPALLTPNGAVITPDIRDAERLQGFPADWTLPAETVARPSRRWALVGAAVTAPVAEWLGRRLAAPGVYDRARDRDPAPQGVWPTAARFDGRRMVAVSIGAVPERIERPPLHEFLRWPGAPLSARATRGFLRRAEAGSLRFPPGFLDRLRAHLARMEQAGPDRTGAAPRPNGALVS